MNDKIFDTHDVKALLGNTLYDYCDRFYTDFIISGCKFKMQMTRRCSTLCKIFRKIKNIDLSSQSFLKKIARKGIVMLTDKSLDYYIDEIVKSIKNSHKDEYILCIADDIIIFGRTINDIIDRIVDACLEQGVQMKKVLDKILVKAIVLNADNNIVKSEYKRCIKEEIAVYRGEWKTYSCAISKLIRSVPIPNTSYIVSYTDSNTPANDNLITDLTQYNFNELTNLGVNFYIGQYSLQEGFEVNKYIQNAGIRYYKYNINNNNTFLISPIVIFKEMNTESFQEIVNHCFEKTIINPSTEMGRMLNDNSDRLLSMKFRLLNMIFSHMLLDSFLSRYKITIENSNLSNLDIDSICKYNFTPQISKEFQEWVVKYSHSDHKLDFKPNKNSNNEQNEIVKDTIYRKALEDNQEVIKAKKFGFNKSAHRLAGFTNLDNGESVYLKEYFPSLMNCIDNGIASLKSLYDEKKHQFVTLVYSGEQAFRVFHDKYGWLMDQLCWIEKCSRIKSWSALDKIKNALDDKELTRICEVLYKSYSQEELIKYVEEVYDKSQNIESIYTSYPSLVTLTDEQKQELETFFLKKAESWVKSFE